MASLDLQAHLDLQESLEPSLALWRTSLPVSLHTCDVQILVSTLVVRVLQDHLVLLDLVLDPSQLMLSSPCFREMM